MHKLQAELEQYLQQGLYPMHMPGHKRRIATVPDEALRYDFTEVAGTDDLHHADGILQSAMERTSALVGSDRSWYLVNGSTCGNLAGASAVIPYNGEVIVARNCHRSVFHALELRHAQVHWLWPSAEETGIFEGVRPEDVEALLKAYPASSAVILTSPSYEGVVSDIRRIAAICHRHAIPLMVDEAHGAHFGLVPGLGFPDSAIHQGADLSVQSAHKTLLGMTQTAFLHLRGTRVSERLLEEKLSIFETSSPAYPLMLSLSGCTDIMASDGERLFTAWTAALRRFDTEIQPLRHLRVLCHGRDAVQNHRFYAFDPSKLVIICRDTPWSGYALMDMLRNRFHYELEMAQPDYALAMTGPGDDFSELSRFARALCILDRELDEMEDRRPIAGTADPSEVAKCEMEVPGDRPEASFVRIWPAAMQEAPGETAGLYAMEAGTAPMTLCDAVEAAAETLPFAAAAGHISAEYVYCYPPGIPLVVPGEQITEDVVHMLSQAENGLPALRFSRSEDAEGCLACVQGKY